MAPSGVPAVRNVEDQEDLDHSRMQHSEFEGGGSDDGNQIVHFGLRKWLSWSGVGRTKLYELVG